MRPKSPSKGIYSTELICENGTSPFERVGMAQVCYKGNWHNCIFNCLNNNLSIRPHISVSPYQESHFDQIAYEYTLNPIYSIYYDFRL